MKTFILISLAFAAAVAAPGGDMEMDGGKMGGDMMGGDMEMMSLKEMAAKIPEEKKAAMMPVMKRMMPIVEKMFMHTVKMMIKSGKGGLCPKVKAGLCIGCPKTSGDLLPRMKMAMEKCEIEMPGMESEMESMGGPEETMRMDEEGKMGNMVDQMMTPATKEQMAEQFMKFKCGFAKKMCFLTNMQWYCCKTQSINKGKIQEDLAKTNIGAKLEKACECCSAKSEMITKKCVAKMEGKPSRLPARLRTPEKEDEALLKMIKTTVYFGCMHAKFECACMKAANCKLGMLLKEKMEEAGMGGDNMEGPM